MTIEKIVGKLEEGVCFSMAMLALVFMVVILYLIFFFLTFGVWWVVFNGVGPLLGATAPGAPLWMGWTAAGMSAAITGFLIWLKLEDQV